MTLTNICIASNLSTTASVFLYGMDAMRGAAILSRPYFFRSINTHQKYTPTKGSLVWSAFLWGITGIPQSAKSAGNNATSDRKPESSKQDNREWNRRSGESFTESKRRFYV